MKRIIRRRPSPSLVIASLALLVALGGTGYATISLPANVVGTKQLKADAVISSKVKAGSLLASDFASGQIPAGPAGQAGPEGPSNAYTKFANGPIVIPASLAVLTSLSIPQAGNYVIIAKMVVNATTSGSVGCILAAGSDNDISTAFFAPPTFPASTLASTVSHTFSGADTVNFACATMATATAVLIKITAIKVGSLVNTP